MLALGSLALTGLGPARQAYQQRQAIARQESRLAALNRTNAELAGRLARFNDPAYLEKLAREQLGVVRPGETSYVVVPASAPARPASASKASPGGFSQAAMDWLRRLRKPGRQ